MHELAIEVATWIYEVSQAGGAGVGDARSTAYLTNDSVASAIELIGTGSKKEFSEKWRDGDVPEQQLVFSISVSWGYEGRQNWNDGKIQRVEKFVGEIAHSIKLIAEHSRAREE